MDQKEKVQMDSTKKYRITWQDKSEEIQELNSSHVDTLRMTNFVESVVEIE